MPFGSDDDSDGLVEDEPSARFDCPGYINAREQFEDLLQRHIPTFSHFFAQPQYTGEPSSSYGLWHAA